MSTRATAKSTCASLLLAALCLTLGACVSGPGHAPPVMEDSDTAPIERDRPEADVEDEALAARRPKPSAATASLLAAAHNAAGEHNYADAINYLERAVRIEPRNAALWLELSSAHLADGNTTAANQHVRKAIALASNDPAMTRLAWLQLADVREAEGNLTEARAIRRRYRALRG